MLRPEYMRIHSRYFSSDIRELYDIDAQIADYGYIYIKKMQGMYGLKKESIIAYNQLLQYADNYGYYSIPFTTGL